MMLCRENHNLVKVVQASHYLKCTPESFVETWLTVGKGGNSSVIGKELGMGCIGTY
jgi:hypothetical protein